jgi:pheromone shutdown protein TraB
MKVLDVVLEDVGEDQWIYQLYYMDKKYDFTLPLPFTHMSVLERHKHILSLLSDVFREESLNCLDTRPQDTPEAEMLNDIYEQFREMGDVIQETDDEDDEL